MKALARSNHALKQVDIKSHSLELLQQPLRHQNNFQPFHEGICSDLEGNEMLVAKQMPDYGFHGLNNWDKKEVSFGPVGLLRHGYLNPLSLSMSPGSLPGCVTASKQKITSVSENKHMALEQPKKRANGRGGENQQVHKKSIDAFGKRTSQYRGVTRHRWTGRYEVHHWDNSCKKEGQTRKGRQVYIGGYNMEEKAARAYDLAALKYWGHSTHINFTLKDYQEELVQMKNMSKQEYVSHLRRKSSGFSRDASIYRGVTRHHRHGRWQARIGRVSRNKDLYLGTFGTQEEAAEAYDIAALKFWGANAVTNFSLSSYDVRMIMGSSTLLPGELVRRVEAIEPFDNVSLVDTSNQQSNRSDWQMILHEPQQRAAATSELHDQQSTAANENHHSSCNSANLNGFFGLASGSLEQDMGNPNKVTNTTSWRYGKSNNALLPATQLIFGASSNQLKNVIPMAQMPIFGAWSDD